MMNSEGPTINDFCPNIDDYSGECYELQEKLKKAIKAIKHMIAQCGIDDKMSTIIPGMKIVDIPEGLFDKLLDLAVIASDELNE